MNNESFGTRLTGQMSSRSGRVLLMIGAAALMLMLCGCRKHIATIIMERKVRMLTIPREPLGKLQYSVILPRGYADETNRMWPMVLYLHGIGESGNNLEKVLRFGPPRLMTQGRELPCIVVSPQLPRDYFWFRESNAVLEVLEEVMSRYRIAPDRVHVTGNSMGAFGAILLAAREPQRFASLVPVCGGVDYVDSLRLRDVPVWAFHGEDDPIIPVEESVRLVRLVKNIGGTAKLTVYPGIGHNCWDKAYNEPGLWEWILAQRKR